MNRSMSIPNPDPVMEVMEVCQALDVLINHLIQADDESGRQIALMLRERLQSAAETLDDGGWQQVAVNE